MNNAYILVEGILGLDRDLYDTSYRDIAAGIYQANQNKAQKIILEINSPGGSCSGIDVAINAIESSRIPVETLITGMCASAAYNLACSTAYITAAGPNTCVGSIGAYSSWLDDKKYMEANGLEEWIVISKGSPKKVPQTKEEFTSYFTPLVEESFHLFVANVARGRKVSEEKVLTDFGQGALLMARQALEVGMIDKIIDSQNIKGDTKMQQEDIINYLLSEPEQAVEIITKVCSENESIAQAIKAYLDAQMGSQEETSQEIQEQDPKPAAKTPQRFPSAKADIGYVGAASHQKPMMQQQSYYQRTKEKFMQRAKLRGA